MLGPRAANDGVGPGLLSRDPVGGERCGVASTHRPAGRFGRGTGRRPPSAQWRTGGIAAHARGAQPIGIGGGVGRSPERRGGGELSAASSCGRAHRAHQHRAARVASPRPQRGTPMRRRPGSAISRFIPALAGNTSSRCAPPRSGAVHPRARGAGNRDAARMRSQTAHPRVSRGNRAQRSPGVPGSCFFPPRAGCQPMCRA